MPKTSHPEHEALIGHLGRLQAIRRQIHHQRMLLHERAGQQLDSMPELIDHVGAHVEREQGGGPLAARAHRRLIVERARLHHLVQTRDDDGA